MTERKADQSSERYVPLNKVKRNTKVDVYGVVKFFKQPYKSRGSDYCTMISIVDPSYTDSMDKLKCLLFAKELNKLPLVKLGYIIRFHRLSISEFAGSLQGQSSPGSSWLLFLGDVDSPLEPIKSSSPSFTINDIDRNKVKELRLWANNKDDLHEKLCTFSEVAVGCFFDIVCQVVQTNVIERDVGRLLKVWDGTQCIYDVRDINADNGNEDLQQNKDDKLFQDAQGFIYDVCVFDNHFSSSGNIKPGDYVKFVNLHAAEYKTNNGGKPASVEFVLHRGDSFGRCVQVLEPGSSDLKTLQQRQEIIAMERNFHCSESFADCTNIEEFNRPSTSRAVENNNKQIVTSSKENEPTDINRVSNSQDDISDRPKMSKRTIIEGDGETSVKQAKITSESNECGEEIRETLTGSSEPRCMAKSSTVILNHHHTKISKIKEVLDHIVPYKFKVRVKVQDYHPRPDSVKKFIKLYCSVCNYLSDSQLHIGSTFKGVAHYNCPQCFQNKDVRGLDSQPHLQYIYMMRFILSDSTGMLLANLWKDDAVCFFQDVDPEKLVKDKCNIEHIQECLSEVCPPDRNVEDKPWIECCLKSYSTQEGTKYQIFDSVVV